MSQTPRPPNTTAPAAPALDTVTVVMLTPDDFPGELAASYEDACAVFGYEPQSGGYALTLAQRTRRVPASPS
jgi:hypothetical protein